MGDALHNIHDAETGMMTTAAPALRYHFGIMAGMAMTLRLTPEDERILAELAEAEGVSRHEATLRAIREAAARRGHEAKVAELSAKGRERYADVLDRLGR